MQRHLAELREALQLERDPAGGEGRSHLLRKLGHEQSHVLGDQLDRAHTHQREIILEEIV